MPPTLESPLLTSLATAWGAKQQYGVVDNHVQAISTPKGAGHNNDTRTSTNQAIGRTPQYSPLESSFFSQHSSAGDGDDLFTDQKLLQSKTGFSPLIQHEEKFEKRRQTVSTTVHFSEQNGDYAQLLTSNVAVSFGLPPHQAPDFKCPGLAIKLDDNGRQSFNSTSAVVFGLGSHAAASPQQTREEFLKMKEAFPEKLKNDLLFEEIKAAIQARYDSGELGKPIDTMILYTFSSGQVQPLLSFLLCSLPYKFETQVRDFSNTTKILPVKTQLSSKSRRRPPTSILQPLSLTPAEFFRPKKRRYSCRTPIKIFHLFRKLPAELRHIIWSFAAPSHRTISLSVSKKHDIFKPLNGSEKVPAVLQVCYEARYMTKKVLMPRFCAVYMPQTYIYTDLKTDIIKLDLRSAKRLAEIKDALVVRDRELIQNVEIYFNLDLTDRGIYGAIVKLVLRAPWRSWPNVQTWSFSEVGEVDISRKHIIEVEIKKPAHAFEAEMMVREITKKVKREFEVAKKWMKPEIKLGMRISYL